MGPLGAYRLLKTRKGQGTEKGSAEGIKDKEERKKTKNHSIIHAPSPLFPVVKAMKRSRVMMELVM